MVELENPRDAFFSSIQRIDFCDSMILVQDIEALYAYSLDGKYLTRYGSKGHGKNEYIQLSAFAINKNEKSVQILDSYTSKMLSFSYDGSFLFSTRLPDSFTRDLYRLDYVNKDKMVSNYYVGKKTNTVYRTCDLRRGDVMDVDSFSMATNGTKERFGFHPYSIDDEGNVIYVKPFSNLIGGLDSDSVASVYKIVTNKTVYSDSEMGKIPYTTVINMSYDKDDVFLGFSDIFETSSHLLMNTFLKYQFLVDKRTLEGRRFRDYTMEEDPLSSVPLINICAVKDDYLVGIQETVVLKCLEFSSKGDKYVTRLRDFLKTKDAVGDEGRYVLLFYKLLSNG